MVRPIRTHRWAIVALLVISLFFTTSGHCRKWYKNLARALKFYHEANQALWLLGDPGAERRFGFLVSRVMMLLNPLDRNAERNAWVRKLFNRVVAGSRRRGFQYRVYLTRSKSINAFAIPGGYIFVTRGMLDFVRSDDELACIIGHELAHVNRRHSLKNLRRNLAFVTLVKKAFEDDENKQTWAAIANVFINFRYSRNNEREADRLGMQYAHKAGFDPSGMVTLWERMLVKYGQRINKLTKRFRTHPGHRERAANARKLLKEWNIPFAETNVLSRGISTAATRQLIENGDFEDLDGTRTAPRGWQLLNGASLATDTVRSGSYSVYFERAAPGDGPCVLKSGLIPFSPTDQLVLKGAARSHPTKEGQLWLGFSFFDEGRRPLGTLYPAANGIELSKESWHVYSGKVGSTLDAARRPPEGAHYLAVVASACRLAPGACWVDDIEVTVAEKAPQLLSEGPPPPARSAVRQNLLPNGDFEIEAPGRDQPDRWTCSPAARTSRRKPSQGHLALSITGERAMRREFALSELIPVRSGAPYLLEGDFRATAPCTIDFGYRYYSAEKRVLESSPPAKTVVQRDQWMSLNRRVSVPTDTSMAYIQVTIRARPPVGTTVYVDKVRLFSGAVPGSPRR